MRWQITPKVPQIVEISLKESSPSGEIALCMNDIIVLEFLKSGIVQTIPLSQVQANYLEGKGIPLCTPGGLKSDGLCRIYVSYL